MIYIAKNELSVITKAKDLCSCIMTVTDKSPKRFRFTLVSRLQNYALDVIENLIMANETFVAAGDMHSGKQRMSYQRMAMSRLKLLSYMSELAMKQGCILPKQFEIITKQVYDVENDVLSFVGCMKDIQEPGLVVDRIRKDLEIEDNWFEKCKDVRDAFNYIRQKLEMCGVVVMMNGVVGKNTHRALDVKEFRAFAVVDEWAPLIFINSADSGSAKLFSLFHELAHIWIGMDDLFNDYHNRTDGNRPVEIICNEVAGELLVPKHIFLEKWDIYYNTMGARLDGSFVRALCESINMGRTSYTEAYRLTNTSRKTFSEVVKGLGGVA